MRVSPNGIELIKHFESFRGEAYLDPTGIPTIGWGTTRIYGRPIQLGMMINTPVGELLLAGDLDAVARQVSDFLKVPQNQNQIDALISFQYNTGGLGQSTLLRFINDNMPIYDELFLRWNKARIGGKYVALAGLTRRRQAECDLYNKPYHAENTSIKA